MSGDMKHSLAEILKSAAEQKKFDDKVLTLTMNDSPQLRKMIKYILDPKVVWWEFLKGSPPPYKENRYLDAEGRLYQDMRILYMFVEQGDDWMGITREQKLTRMALQANTRKRERIWIQLLESVSPDDAKLLCAAPNRKFPFEGLPVEVIDAAFPGLLAAGPHSVEDVVQQQPVIKELTTDEILNG